MIVSTALLLAAVAAAPPAPEPEDIEVIGERLKQAEVIVTRDAQGRYQCALGKTTGLAELDAALCEVTTACVRKGEVSHAQVQACVEKGKPGLIARIREFWAARKQGEGA